MSCLYKIEKDIREFLEETPKLFFNERDFQVNLAFFLMKKEYYDNPLCILIKKKIKKVVHLIKKSYI